MNKKWIFIIIVVVIAILAMIIIKSDKEAKRPFKNYDFKESIVITNNLDNKRIDTIAYVLASEVFKFDSLELIITNVPGHYNNPEFIILGIANSFPFNDNLYLILLDENMSIGNYKKVLAHEFIHINQYISKELKPIYIENKVSSFMVYKNDTIDLLEVPYFSRKFEEYAFNKEDEVLKKLNKHLYEN